MKAKDISGQRFCRLVAVRRVENHPQYKQARWLFKCDCGNDYTQFGYVVWHGMSKSCGCLKAETKSHFVHGLTGTTEHRSWCAMRARCTNPKDQAYHLYGGRGIFICERWKNFEAFYEDMGPKPSPLHSLDRIDANKGYSPENCRWADKKTQVRNRRKSNIYSHNGETKNLADWAEHFGLPYQTVWMRHKNGWRGNRLFSPLGPTSGKKQGSLVVSSCHQSG